jgi:ADP-ribose pyrophosphatase
MSRTLRPWIVRREQMLLSCPPYLEVSAQSVELPDGRMIDDFYQIAMPDYATIFPETEDGRVLLLRSYRHGPRRVCLAFPGGQLARGEPALAAAERELLEETGYRAAAWQALGSFVTQANQRCQTAHFFHARGCAKLRPPDSGDLEEHEEHEVLSMTREEILAALARGEFPILEHAALLALVTNPHLGGQLSAAVSRAPPPR